MKVDKSGSFPILTLAELAALDRQGEERIRQMVEANKRAWSEYLDYGQDDD